MLILINFDETLTLRPTYYRIRHKELLGLPTNFQYHYCASNEIYKNMKDPEQAKPILIQRKSLGDTLGILSNNPNKDLIEKYLIELFGANLLGDHWKNIISEICAGNGYFTNRIDDIKMLAEKYNTPLSETVLIDDNVQQRQWALEAGINCIVADFCGSHWQYLAEGNFCKPDVASAS